MTQAPISIHTTTPQLLRATGMAILAATVILVTIVVPAEYGRDPTGIGTALGLTALGAEAAEPVGPEPAPATGSAPVPAPARAGEAPLPRDNPMAVVASATPFATGEMSLTLQANEGAEIKALMRAQESFVFSWVSDGPVNFDMHGERPDGGKDFSSYWKDRGQTRGHGRFIAPFDGTHGWYWRNRGEQPVTVTVKVAGYYEKLYRP